jgi:hypothetical protein
MPSNLLVETVLSISSINQQESLPRALSLIRRQLDSFEQSTPKPSPGDVEFVEGMAVDILSKRLNYRPKHRTG